MVYTLTLKVSYELALDGYKLLILKNLNIESLTPQVSGSEELPCKCRCMHASQTSVCRLLLDLDLSFTRTTPDEALRLSTGISVVSISP